MRTSYSREHGKEEPKKNIKESKKVEVKEEIKEEVNEEVDRSTEDTITVNAENMLINAYNSMESVLNSSKGNLEEKYNEGYTPESLNSINTPVNPVKPVKKKSRKGLIIGCSVTIAVVALGVGGYTVYDRFFNTKKALEATEEDIDMLYTSIEKSDIKSGINQSDLNEYYMDLIGIQKKGANVDDAVEELDTIGYFLEDKHKLEIYNSEEFNLSTVGLSDSISSILDNTRKYTVSGLVVTINDMSKEVTEDYENFINLRQELNGISDVINFDAEWYKSKIESVDHIPNKTELNAIYEKLVVDRKAAIAQKKVQEAADDQARAEAEKNLQEAQALQKKTQEELEATKKKLEEEAKKASEELSSGSSVEGSNLEEPSKEETDNTWKEQEGTFDSTDSGSDGGVAIPIPQE